MFPGWLKPLVSKPKVQRICAFDVEGRGGPGGFVCGSIVSDEGTSFYLDPGAMFEALLSEGMAGKWLFAHNLEYDLPIVAGDRLLEGDLLFKNTGLLWATYPVSGRKANFYDSTNLFPRLTIQKLGKMVGLPKLEIPDDQLAALAGSAAWGGLSPQEQLGVRAYCTRDAEIAARSVGLLQEELLSLGGELRPTIAGCAMDLYRRTFHRWPWQALGPAMNGIARGAFYGGRTEAFVLGKVENVNLYDTNSLYPYVQSTARFPHPGHMTLATDLRGIDALEGAEGVAEAVLEAPESYLPALPWRWDHRLFFPVGPLVGTWTLAELRSATARGYVVREIRWALYSKTLFNPFEAYVGELWKRRQGYLAEDNGRAAIVKLLLNSLYGRFGLNPDEGLWRILPDQLDPGDGRYRGFVTSEINGIPVMAGPVRSERQPKYVNVLIAAQVAAAARLHLLSALEEQGEDTIYCDTDSIITRGRLAEQDDLGGWRLQMGNGTADLVGPKEYALHSQVLGDQAVAKGVPEHLAGAYLQTGSARFHRALRVREALSQGRDPSEWVEVLKERRAAIPKRCPAVPFDTSASDFTLTVPWHSEELQSMALPAPPYRYRPVRHPAL